MRYLLILVALILPVALVAQNGPATLLADRILFGPDKPLIAEGHVEVLYDGRRLTATRIIYDPKTGQLTVEGPIRLDDGEGSRLLASQAYIDSNLQYGILQSARLVLQDQLQLAAQSIEKLGPRYTRLNRTVTSACRVCKNNPVPLWQIRAREVIHDTEKNQIWFKNMQVRVLDFPIFWAPRLRIPDPTVERATGFLVPRTRTTTQLGAGIKLPYFIAFGDHADVTLTPYLGVETRTLEMAYRQALSFGSLQIQAAGSQDSIRPGSARGYLFGDALFGLPQDYQLALQVRLASDPGYLLDYGYSDEDQLVNLARLSRVNRVLNFSAELANITTLRDSEIPIADTLPSVITDVSWQHRYFPGFGEINAELGLLGLTRESTVDGDGRDVVRLSGRASWRASTIFGPGLLAEAQGAFGAAGYMIDGDSSFNTNAAVVDASLAATLRWPLTRVAPSGVTDLLEPMVQIGWASRTGDTVPNEDSPVAEFDEGNLLALSRFPGLDKADTGARMALGVNWQRATNAGWTFGLTAGKILRFDPAAGFTDASGLSGSVSDLLLAGSLTSTAGFNLNTRALLAEDFDITKATTRIGWATERFDIGASFDWMQADMAENRPDPLGEITMDARWDVTRHWTGRADLRLNAVEEKATRAGFGLSYENECIAIDLSLSRRFTSSASVDPTTDLSFRVVLGGFGEKTKAERRTCSF